MANAEGSVTDGAKTAVSENFFSNVYVKFLLDFMIAILIVIVFIFISKIISTVIKKKIISNSVGKNSDEAEKMATLIGDVIFITLTGFSIFIWLDFLWVDIGLFVGWLSIWIWFAAKEILGNMLAGVLILSTREFKIWDMIQIDDINSRWKLLYFGTIEEITIRYTVIRALNKRRMVIPNLTLIVSPIHTFTSEELVRLETTIKVPFDADVNTIQIIMKESVNSLWFVIEKEKTDILVDSFQESGVIMLARFHVDPNVTKAIPVALSEANRIIYNTLKEKGINVPYPHTVVTVDKNDKNLLQSLLFVKKN